MATAFQPTAFQSDAFQENGGLTDSTVSIGINATQEGDTGALTIVGPQPNNGSPGRRHHPHKFVAYIDGKQYIGDMAYLESVIELLARKQAEEAIDKAKQPKKPRIVIQPPKKAPAQKSATPVEMQVQTEVRQIYKQTYDRVYQQLEDEEETLAVLL